MDIRRLTPNYAVAPQIDPSDFAILAAEGFVAVINNRPDMEILEPLQSAAMRKAAEAAGLTYVENPVINGAMTMEMVETQGQVVADAAGPVFAWCRSGTRSSIVWALSQAGKQPTDDLIAALKSGGYEVPGLAAQIEQLAGR